jgi:hypothetical protein
MCTCSWRLLLCFFALFSDQCLCFLSVLEGLGDHLLDDLEDPGHFLSFFSDQLLDFFPFLEDQEDLSDHLLDDLADLDHFLSLFSDQFLGFFPFLEDQEDLGDHLADPDHFL